MVRFEVEQMEGDDGSAETQGFLSTLEKAVFVGWRAYCIIYVTKLTSVVEKLIIRVQLH